MVRAFFLVEVVCASDLFFRLIAFCSKKYAHTKVSLSFRTFMRLARECLTLDGPHLFSTLYITDTNENGLSTISVTSSCRCRRRLRRPAVQGSRRGAVQRCVILFIKLLQWFANSFPIAPICIESIVSSPTIGSLSTVRYKLVSRTPIPQIFPCLLFVC